MVTNKTTQKHFQTIRISVSHTKFLDFFSRKFFQKVENGHLFCPFLDNGNLFTNFKNLIKISKIDKIILNTKFIIIYIALYKCQYVQNAYFMA
jgi:histone deacetylase complex regulatory component SIN3